MNEASKNLVVLACSATKLDVANQLPAIALYDGPLFRVLRSYLREYRWPESLSVAVLSAKYGLIGGLAEIATYDWRMTTNRANELYGSVNKTLAEWSTAHSRVDLILGQDYLSSIDRRQVHQLYPASHVAEGPIGMKLNQLHRLLRTIGSACRPSTLELQRRDSLTYFLPDWDDFIDEDFDFGNDTFSCKDRSKRNEKHVSTLMRPKRVCDGVVVSLAQHLGSKGLLRRVRSSDPSLLTPRSVRHHFSLAEDQYAFGDCGAFSYVSEPAPSISVDQAVVLYDLYDFDLGASVDHIPVPYLSVSSGKRLLTDAERLERVKVTRNNAAEFLQVHKERRARFIPVGVIQGLDADSYARQIDEYVEMGYDYLALGGLVLRTNKEIEKIVVEVDKKLKIRKNKPWIHLFGIFRPALQSLFRESGIASFDSATYFRKAWLRSDQNYLGTDGQWYAAIRVPPLSDPRIRQRINMSGHSEVELARLEGEVLTKLHQYEKKKASLRETLDSVRTYDGLLSRAQGIDQNLYEAYGETLEKRPWEKCDCPMCSKLGIDVIIFRGKNRNKSRGAHNTLQLYEKANSAT
jgi:hypothetical protein